MALVKNWFVSIIGPQGIGKTALCKMVSHHLLDRKLFEDGIIFLNMRGLTSPLTFLETLY